MALRLDANAAKQFLGLVKAKGDASTPELKMLESAVRAGHGVVVEESVWAARGLANWLLDHGTKFEQPRQGPSANQLMGDTAPGQYVGSFNWEEPVGGRNAEAGAYLPAQPQVPNPNFDDEALLKKKP